MTVEGLVYRPTEAQAPLGIRPTKFWALAKSGAIETRKLGGSTVVPAEALKAFVANLPKVGEPAEIGGEVQ